MTKITRDIIWKVLKCWILPDVARSAQGIEVGFLSFIHALQARSGSVGAATFFWCLDVMRENQASPAQRAGFWEPNEWEAPLVDFCRQLIACVLTWNCEATEKCPPSPTSVHACTTISRLINCESRSLETLNHSFSILSRAASLAALTRGSTLSTQHWRRRWQQRWWAQGIYSRWCGGVPQGEPSDLDREGWSADVSCYLCRRATWDIFRLGRSWVLWRMKQSHPLVPRAHPHSSFFVLC